MIRSTPWLIIVLASSLACERVAEQTAPASPRPVAADPAFLEQYAETYRFRLGKPSAITVTPDDKAVLFLRSKARSFVRDLYEYDIETGEERVLTTADQLLGGAQEYLSAEELARRERMRQTARGIASYSLSEDGKRVLVPLSGRLFVLERTTGNTKELVSDAGYAIDPQLSPNGAKVTCVRDGDLYVLDIDTGEERRLTTRSSDTVTNGEAEFVAQEEMNRYHGTWWSADSEWLAYQQTDLAGLETMHILDPMHPEEPARAWPYPRPGKKNAEVRLGIVWANGGSTTWVDWDRQRYPYLATVKWPKAGPLTLVVQSRAQDEVAVLAVERETGKTRVLLIERDAAWLNIDQDVPRWLADGRTFVWSTERHGWRQLEYRRADGGLLYALTPKGLAYGTVLDADPGTHQLFITATDDPIEQHVYRVELREPLGSPTSLTEDPGMHGATFGKGHRVYVHSEALLSGTERWVVRERDGSELGQLRSVAEPAPFAPNLEIAVTRGDLALNAAIVRPRAVEPGRRYPVIVYVYGGPRHTVVRALPSAWLLQQWIADHGFIVVSLDGRGTPKRGRDWERAIRGNFIDIPLADQVAGLRALGGEYPELDLERVGIYGWSFGGYFSAMAAMRHGDLFKAAVAGAPVTDWLDYDTHYTERYLGLPDDNPEGYAKSSVLTYAEQLERPLLIIHGTADDNVYFTHSIKLSDALFRAGKDHDFLPLSGFTHMVPDPLVTRRLYSRIVGHFVDHL